MGGREAMTDMNEPRNGHRPGDVHPERRSSRHSHWLRWPRRSRRTADRTEPWNLRFESVGTTVPAGLVNDSPALLVAAVEDICWQAATEGWRARRPHRWRRHAYAAWRAQSDWLDEKRQRLSIMIDDALAAH